MDMQNDDARTQKHEATLERARMHMTAVASGLRDGLGPIDTAGVLIGAAVGVLENAHGPVLAANYLRQVADELGKGPGYFARRVN